MKQTYTKKELAGYLVGLAGQNIIYNIIATGLAFYFQSVIFLPAIACSLIFALARVWDAINDPMMGTIVDKTKTKWGKCKPYHVLHYGSCSLCHIHSRIICWYHKLYRTYSPSYHEAFCGE